MTLGMRGWLPAILTVCLTACGAGTPGRLVSPSPVAVETPGGWLASSKLAQAVEFRKTSGLRFDDTWVKAVAVDPAAIERVPQYSVPLTEAEVRLLEARAGTADEVIAVAQRYGAEHTDVWAGAYIDAAHGRVVALVVGDIAPHEAALRALVSPSAPLDVVTARWSVLEMNALRERIKTSDWLADQGYDLLDLGVDQRRNIVQLHVSSAAPDAVERIAAHFGAGPMLEVTADGTGVTSAATGGLRGMAVDSTGRGVPNLDVEIIGEIPGSGPRGDRGIETSARGEFVYDSVTATGYTVRILSHFGPGGSYLEGSDRVVVGTARTEVRPGAVTFIVILVAATDTQSE